MNCCAKCSKGCGAVLLLVGIAYLVQDLTAWTFFGLNWYTIAFLLLGLGLLGSSCCKDCQACCGSCEMPAPAKKKK